MVTRLRAHVSKKRNLKMEYEPLIFLAVFLIVFIPLANAMGAANLFKTLMSTAHDLLLNVVFFIMAVAVLTGALGTLFSEFGVVFLFNRLLKKLMKPLYSLPGASSLGIFTTFFRIIRLFYLWQKIKNLLSILKSGKFHFFVI